LYDNVRQDNIMSTIIYNNIVFLLPHNRVPLLWRQYYSAIAPISIILIAWYKKKTITSQHDHALHTRKDWSARTTESKSASGKIQHAIKALRYYPAEQGDEASNKILIW